MAEGIIKSINLEKRFGFIKQNAGSDVHFRLQVVKQPPRWEELQLGMKVKFESIQGEKGLTATWVQVITAQGEGNYLPATKPGTSASSHSASTHPSSLSGQNSLESPDYRFLNPYNFVRSLPQVKPSVSENDPAITLLGRCAPPPHDRYVGLSGVIHCKAEAITPVFISDSEGVTENENQHRTYRFFNVEGKKAIPASSLRGMVRSVFEAATNSCFSVLHDQRLNYRLETSRARDLIPAIIVGQKGKWQIKLLTGSASFGNLGRGSYAAKAHLYKVNNQSKRLTAKPPDPISLASLRTPENNTLHGTLCYGILKEDTVWRLVGAANDQQSANLIREKCRNTDQWGKYHVYQGWLCITNQNIDNKHSERFFFSKERTPKIISISDKIIEDYEELIRDYQDRHKRDIEKRKKQGLDPSQAYEKGMAFSRFILDPEERNVRGGELVYALLDGEDIEFIAPVSIPRVAYDHKIGDLLEQDLHHCNSLVSLCPACRTFGWVRGEADQEGAYASRVRFSHAKLDISKPLSSLRLAILGSPKPTTTRFYLVKPDGHPSEQPRSDEECGYDGNRGKNRLRGRKFYRHHSPTDDALHSDVNSDQNRTILDPEDKGAVFSFQVEFENLAPVELGALLWALNLGTQGFHQLGYGKPLGLGSVKIEIAGINAVGIKERYESWNAGENAWRKMSVERVTLLFQRSMLRRYRPIAFQQAEGESRVSPDFIQTEFARLENIADILALLGNEEPQLKVHYPRSFDPKSQGQFEWFVGNKNKNRRKELALAQNDTGLPLIDRKGNIR
jgi:CRISPR-associated protein (TIGR03986 family)